MKLDETLIVALEVIMIIPGLFISYQILRIILGGSWISDDGTLGTILINGGIVLTIIAIITKNTADISYLKSDSKEIKQDLNYITRKLDRLSTNLEVHIQNHKMH